ncbi:hypothetical protein Ahy_B08g092470 [Arachis hypogaea]|uniref:GRF-type domain-containing protein n=1 Tax=Arachis hypogaea TaxID=3818 RepID=A0A444Y403_ARAHY|nr:hypothetical protein Ahy_B08g092470 [Arachis hypogaea]
MSKTNTNPNRQFFGCPLLKVKQTYCKFFVWVDEHIVRLGCVAPTRALGDTQPNDVVEHLGKKELENMMADLEERIVNLENRRSNNCCKDGLKQFSNNATNLNAFYNPSKEVKSNILGCLTTSSGLRKRSTSQHRGSAVGSYLFQQPNTKKCSKTMLLGC